MKNLIRAVAGMLALTVAMEAGAQCAADLTGNGIVDGADLGTVLAYWGPRSQDPTSIASDLSGDALIDGADLGVLLANWGPCQSTITSVTPNQGSVLGGTQVTISGTYLGSTSSVRFGDIPATQFTVVNASTVQATTPAGAAGPATVHLTTAAGVITAVQTFTYMPASVSSIVPNQGVAAGGTLITITGQYLGLTTGVTVGGVACTNVNVVDANTVTAVTPAGTIGFADIVISGSKGTTTVPSGFRFGLVVIPSWATLIDELPDPSVISDPALRASIETTGYAWRVRDTATQMEMLLVPPGTFQMGCSPSNQWGCYSWEYPVHEVTLTKAFYIGRYEVTQDQWQSRMGGNPSRFWSPSAQVPTWTQVSNRPVEQVSWNMIQGYLNATGFRLPTEAEWEYACRAGTQTPFYNGSTDDSLVSQLAWGSSNAEGQTRPVGGLWPNGFGLHDMLGNVWEWVSDRFDVYPSGPQVDPVGPANAVNRVYRGGGWNAISVFLRAHSRGDGGEPELQYPTIGFRVARNP